MSLRETFYGFIGIAVPKEHQPRAQQLLDSVVFKDEITSVAKVKPASTTTTPGTTLSNAPMSVSGSRNDCPALESLIDALVSLGLITDSTIEY